MNNTLKKSLTLFFLFAAACVVYRSSNAQAPRYFSSGPTFLGDRCFQFQVTETESGPISPTAITGKFGLTLVGGQHYILQGIMTSPDGTPIVVGGFLEKQGSKTLGTISLSQNHSPVNAWRDVGIIHLDMDSKLSQGTFYLVGNSFSTSSQEFNNNYAAGSVTAVSCQAPR